jgi:hypothetical protein
MVTRSNSSVGTLAWAAAVLVVGLTVAAACGSSGTDDLGDAGADITSSAVTAAEDGSTNDGEAAAGAETGADADDIGPLLQPSALIAPDQPGGINSVAVAPDGTRIALSSQEALGMPVTIGLYDVLTGERIQITEVDVDGLGRLHWMADNRLVAAANAFDPQWLSWDGTTLAELRSLPLDATCGEGRADKQTGAIYSSDGLTSMGETLCRFDTTDGSTIRTSDETLTSPERFWLVPSTGEVRVLHSPDPDAGLELVTLDGTSLTPNSALFIEFTETVEDVSETVWLTDFETNASRIEPGAIALPRLSADRVSGAGTIFVTTKDSDIVFVSSTDGTVIGNIPAAMNLAFSDWSLDDSVFARLQAEDQIEIYQL